VAPALAPSNNFIQINQVLIFENKKNIREKWQKCFAAVLKDPNKFQFEIRTKCKFSQFFELKKICFSIEEPTQ
jgi:hypothetical protein